MHYYKTLPFNYFSPQQNIEIYSLYINFMNRQLLQCPQNYYYYSVSSDLIRKPKTVAHFLADQ